MSCRRESPLRAPLQMQQSINMAWAAARPSSECGDGTALGSTIALGMRPQETAATEDHEEHGRCSVHGVRGGGLHRREGDCTQRGGASYVEKISLFSSMIGLLTRPC